MKKIIFITMLIISTSSWAELPSWGMTEDQYKLPNFATKMNEIGEQAAQNTWLLKITAPKDWHNSIRAGLTDSGARDVQINFKDSLYQSMAISAAAGIKLNNVSTSSSPAEPVQKQVIMDKPEIDTEIEAPVFEKIDIQSNTDALLENMDLTVPSAIKPAQVIKPTTSAPVTTKPVAEQAEQIQASVEPIVAETVDATPSPAVKPEVIVSDEVKEQENREDLRNKYARNKRVDKSINYENITNDDELFLQDKVVLVKRFVNQGVVLYFWMSESYNPSVHKLIEKGSGKYQKDPSAPKANSNTSPAEVAEEKVVTITDLDFVAVDTERYDQDDLRRDYARNKLVDTKISASQLKKDDLLYVKNNTVMVERPITRAQSAYYWLVGETKITSEVERLDDNRFVIK